MVVSIERGNAPMSSVTIKLSADEAKVLRRVCYYNKTVAAKFRDNPTGGYSKSHAVDGFLNSLGTKLKDSGIDRF
jgi:hypothetical protein